MNKSLYFGVEVLSTTVLIQDTEIDKHMLFKKQKTCTGFLSSYKNTRHAVGTRAIQS